MGFIPVNEPLPNGNEKKYPCGSFGGISIFGFYPNKHATTGEGGMAVTDDDGLAERGILLRNLCFRADRRYVHDEISDNYRLANLQATAGIARPERPGEFVERKRKIGRYYAGALAEGQMDEVAVKVKMALARIRQACWQRENI